MLVFSTGYVIYCPAPLTFSLVSSAPLPVCVNKYTLYTYTVRKGGGGYEVIGGRGPQTDKIPVAKSI
jgi:hypothetical protein